MRRHFSGRSKPLLSVTPDHFPPPGGNHSESHTSPVGSKRWGLPDDVAGPHRYVRTKRPSQKCKRCVDVVRLDLGQEQSWLSSHVASANPLPVSAYCDESLQTGMGDDAYLSPVTCQPVIPSDQRSALTIHSDERLMKDSSSAFASGVATALAMVRDSSAPLVARSTDHDPRWSRRA